MWRIPGARTWWSTWWRIWSPESPPAASCCAWLSGPRRAKRTSEIIVWDLMDRQALVVDERAEEREEEQEQEVAEDATR